MTDRRRPRALGRNAIAVYATTAALFASVFGFLGLRVAQGQDPSLGALTAQVAPSAHTSAHGAAPLRTRTSGGATTAAAPTTVAARRGAQPLGGSRHDD